MTVEIPFNDESHETDEPVKDAFKIDEAKVRGHVVDELVTPPGRHLVGEINRLKPR